MSPRSFFSLKQSHNLKITPPEISLKDSSLLSKPSKKNLKVQTVTTFNLTFATVLLQKRSQVISQGMMANVAH